MTNTDAQRTVGTLVAPRPEAGGCRSGWLVGLVLVVGGVLFLSGCAKSLDSTTGIPGRGVAGMEAPATPEARRVAAPGVPMLAAGEELLVIVPPADGDSVPAAPLPASGGRGVPVEGGAGGGMWAVRGREWETLPLEHRRVEASVVGPLASVRMSQRFANRFARSIEAIYAFPLPADAIVRDFVMTVGARRIRAVVRARSEAQAIYAAARSQGYTASLVVQERRGWFTQSVANLAPGSTMEVTLEYLHLLPYRNGWHELSIPLGRGPAGEGNDTGRVAIDAGVAIEAVMCDRHGATVTRPGASRATVEWAATAALANGVDGPLVVRHRVAGETVRSVWLTEGEARGGFCAVVIYPPALGTNGLAGATRGPVWTELRLDWGGRRVTEPLADPGTDVLPDQPWMVVARLADGEAGRLDSVTISGKDHSGERRTVRAQPAAVLLPAAVAKGGARGVEAEPEVGRRGWATLWASRRLSEWLGRRDAAAGVGREAVRGLALEFGLVSDETALVVVDATTPRATGAAVTGVERKAGAEARPGSVAK